MGRLPTPGSKAASACGGVVPREVELCVTPVLIFTRHPAAHKAKPWDFHRPPGFAGPQLLRVLYETGWLLGVDSQVCEEVDVYGFEAYTSKRANSPYHYFDNVQGVTTVHSFDMAIDIYKLLGEVYPLFLK
jgi:hypothetical protein